MRKRFYLFILTIMMVLCGFNKNIFAASSKTGSFTVTGGQFGVDYYYENKELIILSDANLTIKGSSSTEKIIVEEDANITINNLIITSGSDAAFKILDGVHLNLTIIGDNSLKSGNKYAGLQLDGSNASITITENSTGVIKATGGYEAAGIGGGSNGSVQNITINGGTIYAYSEMSGGAGIGSGYKGDAENITINSGTVYAYSWNDGYVGYNGAGIGSGRNGNVNGININGGNIYAYGDDGAAIGSGLYGEAENIIITGGNITASARGGAGIGLGGNPGSNVNYCNNIIIEGGTITASSNSGAGIGGSGGASAVNNINITGGTIKASSGYGAGIGVAGGTFEGSVSDIIIDGGDITAFSRDNAGIGGGKVDGIFINGGIVNATSDNQCGIGATRNKNADNIYINGGIVTAYSKNSMPGIGASGDGKLFNIYIAGGSVYAYGTAGCNIGSKVTGEVTPLNRPNGEKVYLATVTEVDGVKAVSVDGMDYGLADNHRESSLYLYLAGEDHKVLVDVQKGQKSFKVTWSSARERLMAVDTSIKVTFEMNGGSKIDEQYLPEDGGYAIKPTVKNRSYYIFDGWYRANDFKEKFNFADKVLEDTKIYAKWSKDLAKATISSIESKEYTGKAINPEVTVKWNNTTLKKGTDYKVSYSNNINAGTAKVTVTGINSCKGSISKTFTINKAKQTITASNISKVYGSGAFNIGAKLTKGNGALSYTSNNTKIAVVDKTKGKVTIKGTGKVTIKITAAATANYQAASKNITITVSPKKAEITKFASSKTKTATVTWKKDSTVTGYEIVYSQKKDFSSSKKIVVDKNTTLSKTISSLTKGKTYYVKVRSYTKVSDGKVYGSYSSVKSTKIK